jgi:hypothetical protein
MDDGINVADVYSTTTTSLLPFPWAHYLKKVARMSIDTAVQFPEVQWDVA